MNNIDAWVLYQPKTKKIFAVLDSKISKDLIEKIAEFIYCTNDNKLTLNEMLSNNILTDASRFKVSSNNECFSAGSESDYIVFTLRDIPFKKNEYSHWEIDEEKLLKDL